MWRNLNLAKMKGLQTDETPVRQATVVLRFILLRHMSDVLCEMAQQDASNLDRFGLDRRMRLIATVVLETNERKVVWFDLILFRRFYLDINSMF